MAEFILTKKDRIPEFLCVLLLIFLGTLLRFLPHPPNFAPIAAIALFGGVYLSKRIALVLPILTMVISDMFIGLYEISLMASVYASFLLCAILGIYLKRHKRWYTVLGSSFLCSLIFFVLTNFAVWAFTSWYAKTFSGIIQCYVAALPFFRNTLLGNLFYVSIFFGVYEAVGVWVIKKSARLSMLKVQK